MSRSYHGKIPRRYAAATQSASRCVPMATRSSPGTIRTLSKAAREGSDGSALKGPHGVNSDVR